jgi:hypothetical protein
VIEKGYGARPKLGARSAETGKINPPPAFTISLTQDHE